MAKIIVACEFSGVVRRAFRARGHDAFSCDIQDSLDGSDYHIKEYIEDVDLNYFDMMIAHPPCTHLCVSGARWWKDKQDEQLRAIDFFMWLAEAEVPRICVENPVGIISSVYRKPDQYIQPYQFGHSESKKTGLWLKNLPKLVPTKIIERPSCGYWDNQTPSGQNKLGPSEQRSNLRSITYTGIAEAMASQWDRLLPKRR